MKRPLLYLGTGCTVAALLAAAAVLVVLRERGGDVRGSATVEFTPTDDGETRASRLGGATNPERDLDVEWPTFGYDARRLRSPLGLRLRPPFRRDWTFRAGSLLEFPPGIGYGSLYLPTFDGRLVALDRETGAEIWRYDSGRCAWGSPALWQGLVIQTFIGRRGSCQDDVPGPGWGGRRLRCRRPARFAGVEHTVGTSPRPWWSTGSSTAATGAGRCMRSTLRPGSGAGSSRRTGRSRALQPSARGRVFIGSYDGHVYALDAREGELLWRASAQPRIGTRGRFYSTPAVAYGRVYVGSTDGKVYSFGATTGKLRWSTSTGSYVYASPAIWRRLVLIGSYDGLFYAIDAATGEIRWRFDAGGVVSGSATVLDGIVYFSTFGQKTFGLDAATGQLRWRFPDGFYSPVVADRDRLYLVGAARLYALVER